MIYLDTSVLGAIFFREPGAPQLVSRLQRLRKNGLAISSWSLTEMASVGGIKRRTGAIDARARQEALANFQRFASLHLSLAEVDPMDFRTAALMLDSPAPLRAADALHLAVTQRLGAQLASLDQRQCAGARTLGLRCVDLASTGLKSR